MYSAFPFFIVKIRENHRDAEGYKFEARNTKFETISNDRNSNVPNRQGFGPSDFSCLTP